MVLVFVFLFLTPFSMVISRSVYVATNGNISFIFMVRNIPLYIYIYTLYVYSNICAYTGLPRWR